MWLNVGVQISLTISGYLYARKDINGGITSYYKKRFLKICIPYYIVFTKTSHTEKVC